MAARAKPLILAVDDVPENIDVLKGILTPEYALSAVINGHLALKIAEKQQPDLILLDVMMPGMDGRGVLNRLKENALTRDIPVIFITALGEKESELNGLELGALDYVSKPVSPTVLRARVAAHLKLQRMRRELEEKSALLQNERELIEEVVRRTSQDNRFDDAKIRVLQRLVDKVGGDVVLSACRPAGHRHILLGDFTGHSLAAALGGIFVSEAFYDLSAMDIDALSVAREINRMLFNRMPIDFFMAAVLVEISPDGGGMRIWNAGLPDCLILMAGGRWIDQPSTQVPLGVTAAFDVEPTATLDLNEVERCYILSDGVIEAENDSGDRFGLERVKEALLNYPSQDAVSGLEKDHHAFMGERPLADDITLVEVLA